MLSDKEILKKLDMSGKRLAHTKAVADECDKLAELFGLSDDDSDALHTAALLHDCTKEHKTDGQIQLCEKYGIKYSEDDTASPKVFHAITGAAYAADVFGANEDICRMIRSHTTGRVGMTLCEKLLYLADYIEETRTWDDCVKLRKFFYSAVKEGKKPLSVILHETLVLSFDMTLKNLIADGDCIHPATVESRNALIREGSKTK